MWVLLAIVGVVSLVLAVLMLWCFSRENDPRAYPGSQYQSLDRVEKIYHLKVPECANKTVRYGRYGQFTVDSLYLHFSEERRCISEFLRMNGLDDENTFIKRGLPFGKGAGERLGWPQDSGKEYVALTGELRAQTEYSSLVHVIVAIDYAATPPVLYLQAGIL